MSGALFLAIVTAILVADLLIALRFLRLADRSESEVGGPPKVGRIDPAAARRFARLMFVVAPLTWLFLAALSFGLLPNDAITPIKF